MDKKSREEDSRRLVGTILGGRYRLTALVGVGGIGSVFRARDADRAGDVAVKVLAPTLLGLPNLRERFRREVRLSGRIEHPNVLDVEDSGETEDGLLFQVMKLLVGETLGARMARARLPVGEVLDVGLQICDGLGAAHAQGVIHRDISQGNVFLVATGGAADEDVRVKLLDFGIAFVLDEARLTRTGEVVGNPRYIAPEVVVGRPAVPASDLYSLGVLLFEALAGRPPFVHARPTDLAILHVTTMPPSLAEAAFGADPALVDLVHRCLAKAPEDRPSDAAAVAAVLREVRERLRDGR